MNYRKTILFLLILLSLSTPSVFGASVYFGSQYRGVSVSGEYFDAPGEKFGVRFTAQEDKSVEKIALYIQREGSLWNATVGIQGDSSGEPDGTYIGANNITIDGVLVDNTGWWEFILASTVPLTNQTVYHIVVDLIWADGTHKIYFRGTHNRGGQSGYNSWLTTHDMNDANMRYESNPSGSWALRTRTPVFVITYTDGSFLGQPYTSVEIAQKVYGSIFHGEWFWSPDYRMTINTLGIYIRKQGTPGDLNISLETEGGTILRSVIIPVEDGFPLFDWEQGPITRIELNTSTLYRLRLRSPGGSSGIYWDVNHPYMDYSAIDWGDLRNASFGYNEDGGIVSHWDGGTVPGPWPYDDLSFRLNITDNPIPPIASADGPYGARSSETIYFDGTGSSDEDGTIVSYSWDWGDGESAGSGVNPTHSYFLSGTYTVTLTVTDNEGMTGQATATSVISASVRETFQEVRDVWGTMFQLIVVVMAFALMIGLLKEETSVDEGEISVGEGEIRGSFLRAVLVLVAGTAVLFILLQVVERL